MVYDFGKRLKELREAKGLSQTKVAKFIKISKTSVSNYENDVTLPTIDVLIKFATFYKVSADYLLGLNRKSLVLNVENAEDEEFLRRTLEFMQSELNKKTK